MASVKSLFLFFPATVTMATKTEAEMTAAAIDTFVSRHETGVLSLARGDEPYAIPISYGYDPTERQFYMRLVSTPESEKRQFLASSPAARLVVYEEDGDTYRSVVAVGTLEEISPEALTVEQIAQYGDAKRPLFEVWAQEKPALDIELYVFVPERLSGRSVVVEREE